MKKLIVFSAAVACFMQLSLVVMAGGYSLVVAHGLLITTASSAPEHGLQQRGVSSCSSGS